MDHKLREASIDFILDKGLVTPISASKRAREMLKNLGPRFIFWDTGYSLCFAIITILVVLAVTHIISPQFRYSGMVAAAPVFYLLISVFAETVERSSGIYELKQTCCYTVGQVTALRTACYSAVGAIYTAIVAALCASCVPEFLCMLPLGLMALVICAGAQIAITRLSRSVWANAIYAAIWMIVSAVLPLCLGATWERVLAGVPSAVSLALAALGAGLMILQITLMLTEVRKYACSQ